MNIPQQTVLLIKKHRFYVEDLIGEGSIGRVWRMRDDLGRPYAMKLVYKLEEPANQSLLRKLPILQRIKGEHFVPIEHFGRLPLEIHDGILRSANEGCVFWIMPCAEASLATYLTSKEEPLQPIALALQLCRAIRKIHSYLIQGPEGKPERLFHGNLKPSNVLLFRRQNRQVLKIGDLLTGGDSESPYLSPEQKQKGPIDFRCDLYAMGKILGELLVGCSGFESYLEALERPEPEERPLALREFVRKLSEEPIRLENKKRSYVHFLLGAHLMEQGHYEYALQDFDSAIALDPELSIAHLYRGDALRQLGKEGEAMVSYGKAIQWNNADARAYENRGEIYAEEERYEEAILDLKKAVLLDPHAASAYGSLGLAYAAAKQYQHALEQFDRFIQLSADFPPAYVDRADVLVELKQFARAVKDYEKALELKIESVEEVREKLNRALRLLEDGN